MTIEKVHEINPKFKNQLCLNQNDTSKIFGVSAGTLDNWRKEGVGPEYLQHKKGSRVMYPKQSIIDYINQNIIITG